MVLVSLKKNNVYSHFPFTGNSSLRSLYNREQKKNLETFSFFNSGENSSALGKCPEQVNFLAGKFR